MKAVLTPGIQSCVWTHCGLQTESDTDSQQTHRPCQRRLDEIHSKCHHGPVHTKSQTNPYNVIHHQSGEQNIYKCTSI